MEPKDKFITINRLRLHYLEWGKPAKEAIILLHGYNNCAATWVPFADKIANKNYVLALDFRGHGDSQWSEEKLYKNEHLAADLDAFIEVLNLERVSIIGHSMGGNIALKYAAGHPKKVSRLVVVDIGPEMSRRVEARGARMLAIKRDTYPTLDGAVAYLEAADPFAPRELLMQEAGYFTRQLPDGSFTWKQHQMFVGWEGQKTPKPAPTSSEGKWQMLRQVTCPVLVLRGKESDILDEDVAKKMVTVMPEATLVTVTGAGHYVHRDNLAQFEKEVLGFLGL